MTATVVDSSAFRSVFAGRDEKLVVALVDRGQEEAIAQLGAEVDALREAGIPAKLVVCGETKAALPGRDDVGFVESWATPLLPPLVQAADAIVGMAANIEDLLSGRQVQRFVKEPGQLRGVFAPGRPRPGKRLILQNDWGLGDELLLSAVAREILRVYPDSQVWIRSRHGFRFPAFVQGGPAATDARVVETIYQHAVLYGPEHHSPFPGHLVQQMLDKVALDTGLRVIAKDVRPELALRPTRRTSEPSVVLHSGTNPRLPSKDWGLPRWNSLAEILRAAGIRIRQVGSHKEPLLPGAEDLRGMPPGELPEVFAESWAVVSVVGFLMHLAEAVRTPAVVIYGGREHPAIDGYPDQVHLSSQPLPCRGRWGCHLGADLDCPHGMKCMELLTPELVARALFSILGAR